MANMGEIKKFFEEGPNGKKVKVAEMKALSPADRKELSTLLDKSGS